MRRIKKRQFSEEQSQQSYRDGYLAARKRLTNAGLCVPMDESKSMRVAVNSVGNDRMIVTQRSLDTDPTLTAFLMKELFSFLKRQKYILKLQNHLIKLQKTRCLLS